MNIELIASTNGMKNLEDMLKFGTKCARICYTDKDWPELEKEKFKKKLLNHLVKSGHHSVLEHVNLTYYFNEMPKSLVMILNNEKQYATSEKSARYTEMENIEPEQKRLYDKWMNLLIPEIDKVYPMMDDSIKRDLAIKKLGQENARYMTSVFTPTKMVHTINLRQLNFLQEKFEYFVAQYRNNNNNNNNSNNNKSRFNSNYKPRLAEHMQEFLEQTKEYRVPGLESQIDRELSLLDNRNLAPDHYNENYARTYLLSFAGLAQAQRHRTISYNVLDDISLGAHYGFYVPSIVEVAGYQNEWFKDLELVAKEDFPQAQTLKVYERGRLEDFRSKALLRICGHAQHEIMRNTLETAKKYKKFQETYGMEILKPKCAQKMDCANPCTWKGSKAIQRLV